MIKKLGFLGLSAFLLIAIDQLTKTYVHTQMKLNESITIIPSFFNITYAQNYGAAFGFMDQEHLHFRELFMLSMPAIACLIILVLMMQISETKKIQIFSLCLVFGGALGNYIDRLNYGYVVDFIDLHIKDKFLFPIFNIADTAIVCGILVFIVSLFLDKESKASTT